MNKVGEIL